MYLLVPSTLAYEHFMGCHTFLQCKSHPSLLSQHSQAIRIMKVTFDNNMNKPSRQGLITKLCHEFLHVASFLLFPCSCQGTPPGGEEPMNTAPLLETNFVQNVKKCSPSHEKFIFMGSHFRTLSSLSYKLYREYFHPFLK